MAAWRLGAAALCAGTAASGAVLVSSLHANSARCYTDGRQPTGSAAAAAATAAATAERELAALTDWLRQQGADVDAILFKQSEKDQGRFGVYAGESMRQRGARSWLGTLAGWAGWGRDAPVSVAAFPLGSTLTAANLAQHPQQGSVFQELMHLGVVDERTAVILHLAVEWQRLREARGSAGAGSSGRGELPWLALLPESFGTTLYFSELDMQWLRGTTLHKATRLRQKALREGWVRLQPAAVQLAGQSGLAAAPSFEDWVWANSIFWSRAIAFPTLAPDGGKGVVVQEGIVPGLDFCNHASPSPCYWTVAAAAALRRGPHRGASADQATPAAHAAGSLTGGSIDLVCPRNALPAAGQELAIDYGGKSNEELMFLYGFALEDNPDEVVTLMCPLPPAGEWDELMRARLMLLQQRGLRPQLHLPAAELAQLGSSTAGTTGAAAGNKSSKGKAAAAQGSSGGGQGGSGTTLAAAGLPEDVLRTLEVFVMQPRQILQELEAGEVGETGSAAGSSGGSVSSSGNGGGSGGSGGGSGVQDMSEGERSGQRMAVLTTLVRLLEVKALEQEGQEGTGPLEADQQLLAAAGEALPRNQRHALAYRMGQKALARAFLAHAKRLLQQEMAHLARLQRGGA